MESEEKIIKETEELCDTIKLLTKKININMKKIKRYGEVEKNEKIEKIEKILVLKKEKKKDKAAGLRSYDWNNSIINWKNSLRE